MWYIVWKANDESGKHIINQIIVNTLQIVQSAAFGIP
jgi:hypothetical protein